MSATPIGGHTEPWKMGGSQMLSTEGEHWSNSLGQEPFTDIKKPSLT